MDSQYFRSCFADIKAASDADSRHGVKFQNFQNLDESASDIRDCLFADIALGVRHRINRFDCMKMILSSLNFGHVTFFI